MACASANFDQRPGTIGMRGRSLIFLILLLCMRAAAASISGLPLVEVRAQRDSDLLAVFVSGNGGWTKIDRQVSARLAAAGVHVVGVNSLRYFWSRRSPEGATQDLARLLRYYLRFEPAEMRVLLIGFSTGADVLPFLVNRLPADLRARTASVILISPGYEAAFTIHFLELIRQADSHGAALLPEIQRLQPLPVLCVYGAGDFSSLCPALPDQYATVMLIGRGHHVGGRYELLAERILAFAPPNTVRTTETVER